MMPTASTQMKMALWKLCAWNKGQYDAMVIYVYKYLSQINEPSSLSDHIHLSNFNDLLVWLASMQAIYRKIIFLLPAT